MPRLIPLNFIDGCRLIIRLRSWISVIGPSCCFGCFRVPLPIVGIDYSLVCIIHSFVSRWLMITYGELLNGLKSVNFSRNGTIFPIFLKRTLLKIHNYIKLMVKLEKRFWIWSEFVRNKLRWTWLRSSWALI